MPENGRRDLIRRLNLKLLSQGEHFLLIQWANSAQFLFAYT